MKEGKSNSNDIYLPTLKTMTFKDISTIQKY